MRTPPGSRDARTGRVSGFQSEAQRENFLAARARFSDGPNRDEVILCWAFASRGRLNARLGGLKASEVKGQDGLV